MEGFIEKLTISDIKLMDKDFTSVDLYNGKEIEVDETKDIFFKVNKEDEFALHIYRIDKTWHPSMIFHEFKGVCPFCKSDDDMVCEMFEDEHEYLFETLINHPKIRLKLVFNQKQA